jgi:hypothetical protein
MKRLFLLSGVMETSKRAKVKLSYAYRAMMWALCKHIALHLALTHTKTVKPQLAIKACSEVFGGKFYAQE